jgi:hypothetical protein
MGLRLGSRWRSTQGGTEVIVVRAASEDVSLHCSGAAMVAFEDKAIDGGEVPGSEAQVRLGKRYESVERGVEVLCTKPGPGPLSVEGVELVEKGAKPLPSSD